MTPRSSVATSDTAFTPSHRGGSGPPLVLLHGFTDTWRTWELVLGALERRHDVLAPTLAGHAGGPPLPPGRPAGALADAVEAAMDAAGFETAHVAGNSLGGHVALQLAERGRARTVVALAPAGGWAPGDDSWAEVLDFFEDRQRAVIAAAPQAEAIMATELGRRRAAEHIATNYERIPPALLAHQLRGAAGCDATTMIEQGRIQGWPVDLDRVACPVRFVWGTADRILPWPRAAARFREALWHADWVELEGVGHCPQLDVPTETAQLIAGFARNPVSP
jgi:pimeloyl-ACP methyl ester carboxylesterase